MSATKQEKHLFLVSTPLHLLVSIAIVDTQKLENAHLVFIDQVEDAANPYLATIQNWCHSPFKSVEIFYRPPRKPFAKLKARKATFNALKNLVRFMQPSHIYCGNDRRIEFQWSMHNAQKLSADVKGYYLDEGTFTYVGRAASFTFSDRVVDNLVKKLFYGLWWKHPATVGASSWVDTAFVSFPDYVHPLLREKHLVHLDSDYWASEKLNAFCDALITAIGKPEGLADFDTVLTLPHESIIHANPHYKEVLLNVIRQALTEGKNLAVKYHPRDAVDDSLSLSEQGVNVLSKLLPFEALLPGLKYNASVIGDFSTTLISTRILRPDIKVFAIDHGANPKANEFKELYKKLDIQIQE